jgi:ferredoxin-thioredoxin reductase catalytic subunit
MKIVLNTDTEIVKEITEALKKNDGYCPCRLQKTDDTKCMCKEF